MNKSLFFGLLLFSYISFGVSVSSGTGDIWKDCTPARSPLHISSVTIVPNPPTLGSHIYVTVNGTLSHGIGSGHINGTIKYYGVKMYTVDDDLCTVTKQSGYPCPLLPGIYSIHQEGDIPKETPKGHYTGDIHVTSPDSDVEVLCMMLDVILT